MGGCVGERAWPAGTALSAAADEEDWTETLAGMREMGVPSQVLRQFGGLLRAMRSKVRLTARLSRERSCSRE